MARARAETSLQLVCIFLLSEQYEISEPAIFTGDPRSGLMLSELSVEIDAAESLQRRDGDIAFEECGVAPDASPVGGCDAAAAARLTEIEGILESRWARHGVPPRPRSHGGLLSPRRTPMQIYPNRSRNSRPTWRA